MSDWDSDTGSEEETQTKPAPKKPPTTKVINDLDASDASDEEQAKQPQPPQPQSNNQNNCDQNGTNKEEEIEKLKKMKKKMQNYKRKKRQKQNKKKNKQPTAAKAKQNEINSSDDSSSSSSNDNDNDKDKDKNNNNKKMESYEERMRTDNEILFGGVEVDKRTMLSGEVTLKQFPLGSSHDCDNLATQISALLNEKLFEDAINTNDIFLFYKKILSSPVLSKLDMVDAKELANKLNSLLNQKQKAWHKMKNPKNKKKKKPQWIVSAKFASKQSRKTGHVDGQFDADEFSLFD